MRFGYGYFEAFRERHNTELAVMSGDTMSPEQELVQDLLAIITVFGAKLHGLRSYKKVLKDAALEKDQRVSQKKRNKQQDCLHKASHLIAHKLVERTVVVGDLSQRQMVMKAHAERNKHLNRAVFNDWGLYTFVQMLTYKCVLYGKELVFLDERNTSKQCSACGHLQAMPLWKRTYCCTECGLVLDRDENSAINILARYLARLGPHTGDPVRCADVFTAIEHV